MFTVPCIQSESNLLALSQAKKLFKTHHPDEEHKPRLPDSIAQPAAVAEWYGYRTVACFVTGSSPVPLKTRRVGQRCTLNLSRAETSSLGVVW
ncbi:hypothetical protein TNCV_1898241 [Trichonephila clavipes]|uniref:Uncharacterized protein n=1 Tax=Trichonephila clavipes TaxID=2585209 RepID=A0A8X6WF07_TRICX|nr:hypothetical protein TNCV_1898241 [Trichonephila clavipes]